MLVTEHAWEPDVVPVVSVLCIAYNHEKFIRQCLDGFLMQRTSFPIEIVVHDDASTDATAAIIGEYAARHEGLIRPVLQKENQWSKQERFGEKLLSYVRGQYTAICEGDDYWTCPEKLQKQVQFLEANKDCVMCAHQMMHVCEDPMKPQFPSEEEKEFGTLKDLLVRNYTHTCTVMFRSGIAKYPAGFRHVPSGDWFLWILLAMHGSVGFINEVMSAYRMHSGGMATGMALEGKFETVKTSLDVAHQHLGRKYGYLHRRALMNYRIHLAQLYLGRGRRWDCLKALGHVAAACVTCPAVAWKSDELRGGIRELGQPCLERMQRAVRHWHRLRIWLGAMRRVVGLGPRIKGA